jgi:hypothetical protein
MKDREIMAAISPARPLLPPQRSISLPKGGPLTSPSWPRTAIPGRSVPRTLTARAYASACALSITAAARRSTAVSGRPLPPPQATIILLAATARNMVATSRQDAQTRSATPTELCRFGRWHRPRPRARRMRTISQPPVQSGSTKLNRNSTTFPAVSSHSNPGSGDLRWERERPFPRLRDGELRGNTYAVDVHNEMIPKRPSLTSSLRRPRAGARRIRPGSRL